MNEEAITLLQNLPPVYVPNPRYADLSPEAQKVCDRVRQLCEEEAARTGESPFAVLADYQKIAREQGITQLWTASSVVR